MSIWWPAVIPGVGLLLATHFLLHSMRVERAIKRRRYAEALKMLDGPLSWSLASLLRFQRAEALFYSGRAAEAEPILRELVEPLRKPADRLMGSEGLGRVLLALGRYPEARQAFETAAGIAPTRPVAFSGLAELRLLQGEDPGLALADAERALENHRGTTTLSRSRKRVAAIRGNQAWALAALGRGAESEQAIQAGEREMDPEHAPEAAGFYWRAGMAMLAIHHSSAAGYFRKAVELDPQGYYGGLAAARLS